MSEQAKFLPGMTVRILVDAGLVEHAEAGQFVADVPAGTLGVYDCPHPNPRLEGWHMVMVDHPDFKHVLYAPLHPAHFEVVPDEEA